ncbi:MAG: DUF309 domain-containing protein, partial [Planctomycetota bacterium]
VEPAGNSAAVPMGLAALMAFKTLTTFTPGKGSPMADAPPPHSTSPQGRAVPPGSARPRDAAAASNAPDSSGHPESPDGFGATAGGAGRLDSAGLCSNESYHRALRQFDAGEFFECHETLEAIWLRAAGLPRLFLQGLIQWAVACYKWRQGNRRGALVLHRRALEKWRTLPAAFGGLPVAALREHFVELFAGLEAVDASLPVPALAADQLPRLAFAAPPEASLPPAAPASAPRSAS